MSWVIMGAAVFLYIFFFTSDKEITDIKRWFWLVFINKLFNNRGYFSVSWPTGNKCRVVGALSAVNYRLWALCFIDGNQNTRRKPFNPPTPHVLMKHTGVFNIIRLFNIYIYFLNHFVFVIVNITSSSVGFHLV